MPLFKVRENFGRADIPKWLLADMRKNKVMGKIQIKVLFRLIWDQIIHF